MIFLYLICSGAGLVLIGLYGVLVWRLESEGLNDGRH